MNFLRRSLFIFALCSSLSLSACISGSLVDQLAGKDSTPAEEPAPSPAARVYMDEISGILTAFDGSSISLRDGKTDYTFDLSGATVECKNGLLYGDEISVIYEGQMNGTQTESVRALKVADVLHRQSELKERKIEGTITAVTPYSLTMTTAKGNTLTCSTIARPVSFRDGIGPGKQVVVHVIGKLHRLADNRLDPDLMTVISLSDAEPFQIPEAPQIPNELRKETTEEGAQEAVDPAITLQRMRVTLLSSTGQQIVVMPRGSSASITVDLAVTPCYFPGGILPEEEADLYYYGTFNGENLSGVTIDHLRGQDPEKIRASSITSYVRGTVIGKTLDTVTLRTADNILFTFRDKTTDPYPVGSEVQVTVNPAASFHTNIYTIV